MAVNRFRMYVGPLGNLRALPGHPSVRPPDVYQTIPGAVHESLSGARSLDRFGRPRRAWNLVWEMITEDVEVAIQAIMRGSAQAPLYLLDPRKRNCLAEDVSTGGSSTVGSDSFTEVGAGAVAYAAGDVPTDLAGIVAGAQSWTGLTASQKLWGSGQNIAVVSGSAYRLSVYAKGSTNINLAARPFDAAGAEQAAVLSSAKVVTGAWQRFDWEYTPAAGIVSFQFGLNAVGAGTITTTGWMAQVDEALKGWTFGYGCPQVIPSPGQVQGGYWKTKYQSPQLPLLEV